MSPNLTALSYIDNIQKCSDNVQAQVVLFRGPCPGSGAGLDDPGGSLPVQHDSMVYFACSRFYWQLFDRNVNSYLITPTKTPLHKYHKKKKTLKKHKELFIFSSQLWLFEKDMRASFLLPSSTTIHHIYVLC